MYLAPIVAFLDEIGLPVRFGRPRLPTVVPGIGIDRAARRLSRRT